MNGPLVVVGDALLDRDLTGASQRVCPDAPAPVIDDPVEAVRPGGAALAALLAAGDGRAVVLVTALGDDAAGELVRHRLRAAGVEVIDLGLDGPTPEKVRVRAGGQTVARLDRGVRVGPVRSGGPAAGEAGDRLRGASGVLVSDYGRGLCAVPAVRQAIGRLRHAPTVWDPHPRGGAPAPGVLVATPNEREAAGFAPDVAGDGLGPTAARARALARRWSVRAVCVTRGRAGALVAEGDGPPLVVPAVAVTGDVCGAGDRFAATAACRLADGAVVSEAVTAAVAEAGAFVASGGATAWAHGTTAPTEPPEPPGAPGGSAQTAEAVVAAVRARGGTVVATGGCFDLLHAGHVELLAGARALGDCLVVCLNSDSSVRALKGPGRPVVDQFDRERVLRALASVDAVAVFDEPTPVPLLERLRPDVFVKGGDYGGHDLPEAAALARWSGQVVVLPYLAGRSTSDLVKGVRNHAR